MAYFTPTEVLNDIDKTFSIAKVETAVSNKITLVINAVERRKCYLGSIALVDTSGTGGNEALTIKFGNDIVWKEKFTVGSDKIIHFPCIPLVSRENTTVTIEAVADNLISGKIFVVYYFK